MSRCGGVWRLLALLLCLASCQAVGGQARQPVTTPSCGQSEKLPSRNWCDYLPIGPPGPEPLLVQLALAHGDVRFFGAVSSHASADRALAHALESDHVDLEAYARELPAVVCAPDARVPAPRAAYTRMIQDIALIVPGAGNVQVPARANAVIVDFRGLAPGRGLSEQLNAAVGAAIATPVRGLERRVLARRGLADEVCFSKSLYTVHTSTVSLPDVLPHGTRDLPLAVVTGEVMPAEAAVLAATLRTRQRAIILGAGVSVAAAESRWFPVGSSGLHVRDGNLLVDGTHLPDFIAPDVRTDDPLCPLSSARDIPRDISPPSDEAARRSIVEVVPFFRQRQHDAMTRGRARAALVVAYSTTRLFSPNSARRGDILSAFTEGFKQLAGHPSREGLIQTLRRLGASMRDGHVRVLRAPASNDVLPILFANVGIDESQPVPLVRLSAYPLMRAGDEVTSIDGVPAGEWFRSAMRLVSAGTPGHAFLLAAQDLVESGRSHVFGLRGPSGDERLANISPKPRTMLADLRTRNRRPPGWLTDMGAPHVYYVDLDARALPSIEAFERHLAMARNARALVLDLRGYPGTFFRDIAAHLVSSPVSSARYYLQRWLGPDLHHTELQAYSIHPTTPSFAGPVVLLVGSGTVSRAEDLAISLVEARRVLVVGERTAGTDGNITGVQLPAGLAFTFTGMAVHKPDDSVFNGVGIAPDLEVRPTATGLRTGVDEQLKVAARAAAAR